MSPAPGVERLYAAFLRVATAGRGVKWHVDATTVLRIDPR